MLRWRLISAAVIVSVLLLLIWLDYRLLVWHTPGAWLFPLLLLMSVLGTEELLSLLAAREHRPVAWILYVGNIVVPLAFGWPIVAGVIRGPSPAADVDSFGYAVAAIALMTALVLVGEMARFRAPGTATVAAALSVFGICYLGLLISFWTLLRLYHDNEWGMLALFSMLLVTKMADTGAFASGKRFGRHKMTPLLSPGKTWEGTAGGIVTACVVSWLCFRFAGPHMVMQSKYVEPPLLASLAYGALIAVAGMIGDLSESLLKRDMGRKDSSTWLPGLGGVLDIIDAPLIAGPVAWLCWESGMLGP